MKWKPLTSYLLVAWVAPIAFALAVNWNTPDPGMKEADGLEVTFDPARIWVEKDRILKHRSDYFELRIESPTGTLFYHRGPKEDPIEALNRRVPRGTELSVLYRETLEGNVLMKIHANTTPPTTPLAFADVMTEYGKRRNLVYIIASTWWLLANFLAYALWIVEVPPDGADVPGS